MLLMGPDAISTADSWMRRSNDLLNREDRIQPFDYRSLRDAPAVPRKFGRGVLPEPRNFSSSARFCIRIDETLSSSWNNIVYSVAFGTELLVCVEIEHWHPCFFAMSY